MRRINFSLSVVSHGHKNFIASLFQDLAALRRVDFEVILTLNLPEDWEMELGTLPFPTTLICNSAPRKFSENHNAAFAASNGDCFVILNPDIRLANDPFDEFLALSRKYPDSVYAPLVVNGSGMLEDSARNFPTPFFLVRKLLSKLFHIRLTSDFVPAKNDVSMPDWVAGMFIVVPRAVYDRLGGLDERYHMYYEDVDFCARARLAGCRVMVNGYATVIHGAQRDSHRKLRYLIWHLSSALRFFTSKVFLKIQLNRFRDT